MSLSLLVFKTYNVNKIWELTGIFKTGVLILSVGSSRLHWLNVTTGWKHNIKQMRQMPFNAFN